MTTLVVTDGPPSEMLRAPRARVPDPRGLLVPGYEILGERGRGGMGVVYRARQVGLNRMTALKMIRAGAAAGPEERARFRTEAEAIASLKHPNIIQIYEVGEWEGVPYYSMELVEGGSLQRRLQAAVDPARDAARHHPLG